MFIELASLIAQLFHTRLSEACDGLNNKYLIALGASRFIRLGFWWAYRDKMQTFWFLLLCDIIHSIFMGAFLHQYTKTAKANTMDSVLSFSSKKDEKYLQ